MTTLPVSHPASQAGTHLTRRRFLATGMTAAGLASLPFSPALAGKAPRDFKLVAAPASINMVGDEYPATPVWAYNATMPGPEIRIRQGEKIRVAIKNSISRDTTIHWHGLRIAHAMDGVPDLTQPAIKPDETFIYQFTPPDAGTFWYHPHVRGFEQVGRGLYGPLIVEEAIPPKVDRDITWVIDDWRLTKNASISNDFGHPMQMSHGGRMGNTITVNGRTVQKFSVRAGERIRLRLINVANARTFSLVFKGHTPRIIALDGQPVSQPFDVDGQGLVLAPGQRADMILDAIGNPGERMDIIDHYNPRSPYLFSTIVYGDLKPLRASPLDAPITLSPNRLPEPDPATAQRHQLVITGGAMGNMESGIYDGKEKSIRELAGLGMVWAINGVVAHTTAMAPAITLKKGRSHILTMRNDTAWPHPMHLHGHSFRVLRRNGKTVPGKPWLDTVMIDRNETIDVAMVADNPGDWLFHCHVLEHAAAGMSAVIRIK